MKLNINLYYKFSHKIPPTYNWYSLNKNDEFIPSFTKKFLNKFQYYSHEKKIAIIGAGIAGLTFSNFLKRHSDHEFNIYEKNESLPLDEGYGIQLSPNSLKILSQINFNKINNQNLFNPRVLIFIILIIKKYVI